MAHYCAVFTNPTGQVAVLRPNLILVQALQQMTLADAIELVDMNKQGLSHQVVQALYEAMSTRTEIEAVRVIALRDCKGAADLIVAEETGILDPIVRNNPNSPETRFRAAWRRTGSSLPFVDMSLARAQRLNEIRKAREPKLAKSDVDYLRAQERGDLTKQTALKDYRQKLRDLPAKEQPSVDAIMTPEGLAAWEPAWPLDPVP